MIYPTKEEMLHVWNELCFSPSVTKRTSPGWILGETMYFVEIEMQGLAVFQIYIMGPSESKSERKGIYDSCQMSSNLLTCKLTKNEYLMCRDSWNNNKIETLDQLKEYLK